MVSLILCLLFIVYFLSGAHEKVLRKFGLSERDNTLINIGLFLAAAIRSFFTLVESLSVGVLDLGSLVNIGIMWLFVVLNYRRL